MPMPASGAASPDFIFSRIDPESGPTSSELMTWAIEETVSSRPQKVPSRPRKISKPGHVAQQVARLVEPGADRFEDAAHGHLRDGHAPDAVAEQRRHRRQQHRRLAHFEAGIGDAEAVHPLHFRHQARDLAEGEDDADEQHAEDDAVQARIIEEGRPDLPVEHRGECAAQQHEDEHADQEDPWRGQLDEWIRRMRHAARPLPPLRRDTTPGSRRRLCHRRSQMERLAAAFLQALRIRASRSRRMTSLPAMISPLTSILSPSPRSET